jgi:hypothetical protein
MAKCARCQAETILHISGVPICVDCDNKKAPPPGPGTESKKFPTSPRNNPRDRSDGRGEKTASGIGGSLDLFLPVGVLLGKPGSQESGG